MISRHVMRISSSISRIRIDINTISVAFRTHTKGCVYRNGKPGSILCVSGQWRLCCRQHQNRIRQLRAGFCDPEHPEACSGSTAVKHEIAHYLGLEDLPYTSGVTSISTHPAGTCLSPIVRTTSIQQSDTTKAAECALRARLISSDAGGGGSSYQWIETTPTCTTYWDVYEIYYWNDGWHYAGVVYVPFATFCN
jgi:hypothetical protein